MAITITDYLKIDKKKFDELGAFDSFLDINSKLFVHQCYKKGRKMSSLKVHILKL